LGVYTLTVQQLEESVDWYSFLSRPRLPAADSAVKHILHDKTVLVTGAGGSIGSSLALRMAELPLRRLVLLEASESGLHELQPRLGKSGCESRVVSCLGSVTDEALLDEIFVQHTPDWIFHAAAHKHVALLEDHPLAALVNNVLGTQRLCKRAESCGGRMVLLSTDKAAAPASMMGATKRVAEQVVLICGGTAVRLGNVLGSRGSVVETFARQISDGGPITITDPEARRFWLTVEESADLLLSAVVEASNNAGEALLLVPDLKQTHRVGDLAQFMVKQLSRHQEIAVECTGLRFGEKMREVLWAETEEVEEASRNGLRRIHTRLMSKPQLESAMEDLRCSIDRRDLAESLVALQGMVPGYIPSQRVLMAASRWSGAVSV
jgi:FlaA1/EpsC-like NDP-sugar epimerase